MNKCCFCGSPSSVVKFTFPNFHILECSRCGLWRRDRELTPGQLKRLFSSQYFTKEQKDYFKGQFAHKLNLKLSRNKSFASRLQKLEQLTQAKNKSLMDIGCGSGVFLKIAHDRDWQTLGVDISAYAAKFAKKNYGLKIIVNTFEAAKFGRSKFTVITCWDVMSNFQHPEVIFHKVNRLLNQGGVFAFELAVVDSLLNTTSNLIYKLTNGQIFEFSQRGLPFQHAYHFTRNQIKKFARRYGFEIIWAENHEMDYRYSSLPKQFLPFLKMSSWLAKILGKTVRYRIYARKIKTLS